MKFNSLKKTLFAAVLSAALSSAALACTTILVGSEATDDGSYLVARSVDYRAFYAEHMMNMPATKGVKGMFRAKDHGGSNAFEYPFPENGLSYTKVADFDTELNGATGFNSAGVGMSATESIYASDHALKFDPYNEESGFLEEAVIDVVLPRIKSAKEGVELVGRIIEEIGAGAGMGIAFVDNKELWYLETGTGHHWMAVKLPKDVYFVSANQGRLQTFKAGDPNYMSSSGMVEFAQKNGLYDPKKDGDFNFSKAFCRDDSRDRTYNNPRVYRIQKLLSPELQLKPREGRSFPVFAKPAEKLTPERLMALMRDHYQDGDLASHDPYSKGLRGDEPFRPISVFRTQCTHVMQVRPDLPEAIGHVNFISMGMADLGVFIPFYQGLKAFPKDFSIGTDQADSDSAYWKFRKVQTLAMMDYPTLAPIVRERYAAFEADVTKRMEAFEAEYLKIVKTGAKKADQMLQDFNLKVIRDAQAVTENLHNELYSVATRSVQEKVFFKNAKKMD